MKQNIVESARKWLHTPWQHNQRLMGHGVDCIRFIQAVAEENGIDCGDIPERYDRMAKDQTILIKLREKFKEKSDIEPGDLLVFKFIGVPHHLAIATDIGFIHACSEHEKVVEQVMDKRWRRRLVGVFEVWPQ